MQDLIVPIIVMLCFVMIEAIVLEISKKNKVNWLDIIFNLNSGHLMLWLFRGLELVCFNYIYTHFSLNVFASLPIICIWLFALFAWDFGFYWLHRLHHKLPFFWAVHIVHHQGEHFNLSLAVRNSWYSSLTSIPFFAILAIIGVPTSVFVAVSIFHYSIQFINHCALIPKLGFLESIFVTPTHHRVHHIKDQYYSNHNFGGSFIFWDKLFGSFAISPATAVDYGSFGTLSHNPFWASNLPFMRLFNIPFKPNSQQYRYQLPVWQMMMSCILLFSLVLCYIFDYGYGYNDVSIEQYLLFSCLVIATIALGAMAEGLRWGIISWFGLCWLLPLLFIWQLQWSSLYWQIFMGLLALQSTFTLIFWLSKSHQSRESQ